MAAVNTSRRHHANVRAATTVRWSENRCRGCGRAPAVPAEKGKPPRQNAPTTRKDAHPERRKMIMA